MLPIPRRLAILAFALAVLPLPIASIGCGGADQTDKTVVGCLRTGGQLTVIVFTTNVNGDLTRASSLVDEAWRQQ